MMSFLSSRVLVSSDCKQSITVWFLLLTFYSLFLSFVMGKLSYNANCTCRRFVSKDLVQNQSFPVTLTKGGSWALLRKSAVESTTPAQPFCISQEVGDLPRHFHFGEYSKPERVKTMGSRGKINAIWWNKGKSTKIGRYMWIWIDNKFAKFHTKSK